MLGGRIRLAWLFVLPVSGIAFGACTDEPGTRAAPPMSSDAGAEASESITIERASLQVIHGESATVDVVVRQSSPRRLRISVKNTGPGIQVPRVDLEAGATSTKVVVAVDKAVKQGPVSAVSIEASADDDSPALATAPLDLFVRGRAGERDTTFGQSGIWTPPDEFLDEPLVTFRNDGGFYFVSGPAYPIRRFDVSGNAVSSFGDNGALAPRGGVSATSIVWNGTHLHLAGMAEDRAISVVRTDANGVLDLGYGSGGAYRHPYDKDDFLYGSVVDPSGELVLFGVRNSAAMLGYVTSTGAPSLLAGDPSTAVSVQSFGDPRAVSLSARALLVASGPATFVFDRTTRRPIVPGGTTIEDGAFVGTSFVDSMDRWIVGGSSFLDPTQFIARLLPDGTLDRSFGAAGIVRSKFPGAGSIARSPSGKILQLAVVDMGLNGGKQTFRTTIARYTESGVLDSTFGEQGTLVFDDLNPFYLRILPDERILVVGKPFVRFWQ